MEALDIEQKILSFQRQWFEFYDMNRSAVNHDFLRLDSHESVYVVTIEDFSFRLLVTVSPMKLPELLVRQSKNEDSHFDGWSLKKSILNTLFQAVKAITGGVTAIKGQLIKGSGYLVSGAGKLIASGGDAVTGVGKKIALSAHLIPPKHASHPFAKLSGILSSSSSGLSGRSGSSSSSTGHHHGDSSGESK
uniref:Uncharacterized protein n=1 Tax=Anopheles maculatus TaxID=74869 RepID=A0A182SSA5_9DIPT